MNPNCATIQQRLAEDGPQAFRDDADAREHLAACDGCFAFLESLSELDEELRSLPSLDVADEVVDQLLAREEIASRKLGFFGTVRSRFAPPRRWIAIAGSTAAAAVLLFLFVGRPDSLSGPTGSAERSAEDLSSLRSLGYVSQSKPPPAPPPKRRPPTILPEQSQEEIYGPDGTAQFGFLAEEEGGEGEAMGGLGLAGDDMVLERWFDAGNTGSDAEQGEGTDEAAQQRVTVIATPDVIELENTASTTKFSDEYIQDLPVPGRYYGNILTLAPGVQDADNEPTVHGSRDFRANSLTDLRLFGENEKNSEQSGKIDAPALSPPLPIDGSHGAPAYPDAFRNEAIEVTVWLQIVLDAKGNVEQASVLRSDHDAPIFGRQAVEAAMQWRYLPATLNGKAVRVVFTEPVLFQLESPGSDSRVVPASDDGAIELARNFLRARASLGGLSPQPARGYWKNTYLPGDPTARLLQAKLAGWSAPLHQASRRIGQPFDTPQNAALAVYLHTDRRAVDGESRLLVQVGLKGTSRHGGRRPPMNLAVVLDLTDPVGAGVSSSIRSLLAALNEAKQPGDRFSLFVAGPSGGLVVAADEFRHGVLRVTLDRLLAERPSGKTAGVSIGTALSAAIDRIASTDDPNMPLGSSAVMLVTGRTIGAESHALSLLAHRSAIAGVPVSAVGIGTDVSPAEIDQLALAGQGRRRLLDDPRAAAGLIDRELSAATRSIARAVRLRIRLAPGVKLIDVVGSDRLDAARSQRVRDAERSIDQRLSKNLGIESDRGEDEDGIQIVIPNFYAGDTHVILLDVVVPGSGPIADVTVRYKDLVQLRNGVGRSSLALARGTEAAGPLEHNVLKNLLSLRLAEKLEQAGLAVAVGETARAREQLDDFRRLLAGLRVELPGFDNDPEIAADIAMLGEYGSLLPSSGIAESPARLEQLSDSLRFAARLKVQPRPLEIRS